MVIVGLNLENEHVKEHAYKVYEKLVDAGVDVLFDDRENVNAGEKFADADLIGIPYRLVVSEKTGNKVELKKRNEKESHLMDDSALITAVN